MSNENKNIELDPTLKAVTDDLRQDDFKLKQAESTEKPVHSFVKPRVKSTEDPTPVPVVELTVEQQLAASQFLESEMRRLVASGKFNPSAENQILPKSKTPITDFSNMSLDDVYDLSVPIEAKPFMSADVLSIKLKDTNYEARWVNKNPQRLGDMIAKGFTYIEPSDLISADGIQTGLDSSGHYSFNDVVAMKIDKATYYKALRAAHERAVSTTDQSNSRKRAARAANGFMESTEFAGDFKQAAANKQMQFYDPGIEA